MITLYRYMQNKCTCMQYIAMHFVYLHVCAFAHVCIGMHVCVSVWMRCRYVYMNICDWILENHSKSHILYFEKYQFEILIEATVAC